MATIVDVFENDYLKFKNKYDEDYINKALRETIETLEILGTYKRTDDISDVFSRSDLRKVEFFTQTCSDYQEFVGNIIEEHKADFNTVDFNLPKVFRMILMIILLHRPIVLEGINIKEKLNEKEYEMLSDILDSSLIRWVCPGIYFKGNRIAQDTNKKFDSKKFKNQYSELFK